MIHNFFTFKAILFTSVQSVECHVHLVIRVFAIPYFKTSLIHETFQIW